MFGVELLTRAASVRLDKKRIYIVFLIIYRNFISPETFYISLSCYLIFTYLFLETWGMILVGVVEAEFARIF